MRADELQRLRRACGAARATRASVRCCDHHHADRRPAVGMLAEDDETEERRPDDLQVGERRQASTRAPSGRRASGNQCPSPASAPSSRKSAASRSGPRHFDAAPTAARATARPCRRSRCRKASYAAARRAACASASDRARCRPPSGSATAPQDGTPTSRAQQDQDADEAHDRRDDRDRASGRSLKYPAATASRQ